MATNTQTIQEHARELRELRDEEAQKKSEYDEVAGERKRVEAELFERMRDEEVDGLKLDGKNFVPAETPYAHVQDREALIEWLRENGDDTMIEEKPRKENLSQLVREHLDNGTPLPPGLGFYIKEYISLRAA